MGQIQIRKNNIILNMKLFWLTSIIFCQEVPDDVYIRDGQILGQTRFARASDDRASDDPGIRAERRHADLLGMMTKWWKRNGLRGKNSFDAEKYWAYGCHCVLLGSQPITQAGHGTPKDGMDVACRAFKDCQKCIKSEYGNTCNGEFKKYSWKWSTKQGDFITPDEPGTCSRALFECDKSFVYSLFDAKEVYNQRYHWYSGFEASYDDNCGVDNKNGLLFSFRANDPHACCGGFDRPFVRYSREVSKCCRSGITKPADEEC